MTEITPNITTNFDDPIINHQFSTSITADPVIKSHLVSNNDSVSRSGPRPKSEGAVHTSSGASSKEEPPLGLRPKSEGAACTIKEGPTQFLLGQSIEKGITLTSSTMPPGCPNIAFKPPVHRRYERGYYSHNKAKSKGIQKRPPRTAYTDVPLRMLGGSQSDIESSDQVSSPTHSLPLSIDRNSDRQVNIQVIVPTECQNVHGKPGLQHDINYDADNEQGEMITPNGMPGFHTTQSQKSSNSSKHLTTMTGTIKRGKKQDLVSVNLNKDEIDAMNRSTMMDRDKHSDSKCGARMGLHILILSLFYMPLAFLSSLVVSFYTGSLCWYNIHTYLSEEKTIAHKLLLCPLLIIFYPFLIILFSVGIAIYASFLQVSWYFSSWYKEIKDFDKNFYGWLCDRMGLSQCSPYEVIIIDDEAFKAGMLFTSQISKENEVVVVDIPVEMTVISSNTYAAVISQKEEENIRSSLQNDVLNVIRENDENASKSQKVEGNKGKSDKKSIKSCDNYNEKIQSRSCDVKRKSHPNIEKSSKSRSSDLKRKEVKGRQKSHDEESPLIAIKAYVEPPALFPVVEPIIQPFETTGLVVITETTCLLPTKTDENTVATQLDNTGNGNNNTNPQKDRDKKLYSHSDLELEFLSSDSLKDAIVDIMNEAHGAFCMDSSHEESSLKKELSPSRNHSNRSNKKDKEHRRMLRKSGLISSEDDENINSLLCSSGIDINTYKLDKSTRSELDSFLAAGDKFVLNPMEMSGYGDAMNEQLAKHYLITDDDDDLNNVIVEHDDMGSINDILDDDILIESDGELLDSDNLNTSHDDSAELDNVIVDDNIGVDDDDDVLNDVIIETDLGEEEKWLGNTKKHSISAMSEDLEPVNEEEELLEESLFTSG